jgi:MtrB/PioB family decaheme-associated outer membrane protein
MRITRTLITLSFLLTPLPAAAQGTPTTPQGSQTPPTPPATAITSGIADFGLRGTDGSGDLARYERYRDMGNGGYLNQFHITRERSGWLFEGLMNNPGRTDQRYYGSAGKPGRLTLWGMWDQIPMLMSRTTQTMFIENVASEPSIFTIPDALQAQMQATTAAARPAVFEANSITFDTRSQRNIGLGGVEFLPNRDLTLQSILSVTHREGTLPYGGSFGHNSMVEMPAPIRHRLTDWDSSAEYTRGNWLFRGGFLGSWFHNDVTQVEFDSPFQAVDLTNTPSRGRLSLAPSNSFLSANGMASVRLPRRTRATAYVSLGSLSDAGDALMPQTINAVNVPLLVALPRTTVEGHARTSGVNLTFTSRPTKLLDFSARYRLYDYDNETPDFVLPQRVSYDNTPGTPSFTTLGGVSPSPAIVETEPFGVKRQYFDADMRVQGLRFGTPSVGYSRLEEDRTHRFFESTGEDVFRVTYDIFGIGMYSLRTKYEHGRKRGEVTDEAQRDLFNIGEQPQLRQFDIAQRNRDRVTILGSVTPMSTLSFNASVAVGRDDYFESTFGLRDYKHQVYTGGLDFVPHDKITVGLSYDYERYEAIMHSRSASGATSPTMTYEQFLTFVPPPVPVGGSAIADPRYDWGNTGTDRVHSVIATLGILKIREKLDLRFFYDFNRAHSLYSYSTASNIPLRTLPADVDPSQTALPPPSQLPLVKNKLQRGTFDAIWALTDRIGVGGSFWYEDYRVSDYTLDEDANPELVRGNSMLLGYMYRPYTARTVFARMIVNW